MLFGVPSASGCQHSGVPIAGQRGDPSRGAGAEQWGRGQVGRRWVPLGVCGGQPQELGTPVDLRDALSRPPGPPPQPGPPPAPLTPQPWRRAWWTGWSVGRVAPRQTATGGQRPQGGPISGASGARGRRAGHKMAAGASPGLGQDWALAEGDPTPPSAQSHPQAGRVTLGTLLPVLEPQRRGS